MSVKEILNKQMPVIRNLMSLTEKETFGDIEVSLDDYEVYNTDIETLYSVIISVEMVTYINPDFTSISDMLTHISNKIDSVFRKVSFDDSGKLKKPDTDSVNYSGTMVLKIEFKYDDEELKVIFHSMFTR